MLFAGLAASAAVDLLALLQPEKKASAKSGTSLTAQPAFSVADHGAAETAPTQSQSLSAGGRAEGLSRDALDTLLASQGQSTQRKKKSTSVLLDLLHSSQNGTVGKSEFDAATGDSGSKTSGLFDRIDQDRDGSINATEMSLYLNTYRRTADAAARSGTHALAKVA
jgi:hypothetical protein